jgi:hypothetical protein
MLEMIKINSTSRVCYCDAMYRELVGRRFAEMDA